MPVKMLRLSQLGKGDNAVVLLNLTHKYISSKLLLVLCLPLFRGATVLIGSYCSDRKYNLQHIKAVFVAGRSTELVNSLSLFHEHSRSTHHFFTDTIIKCWEYIISDKTRRTNDAKKYVQSSANIEKLLLKRRR